jgi:hypothetical protein
MPVIGKFTSHPTQNTFEELTNLWLASLNRTESRQIPESDRNRSHQKYKFPVKWWDVEREKESDSVLLSFRLPDNAELAFQFSADAAILMCEVLRLSLGIAVPEQAPRTPSNLKIATSSGPDPREL